MHREGLCLYAYGKRVRILTREESKRRNAALPIPKNYTASVIAVCGGFPRLPSSASSLPPCRIWRKQLPSVGGVHPTSSRFFYALTKKTKPILASDGLCQWYGRTQKSTPKTVYIDLICVHRGLCVWMRKALQWIACLKKITNNLCGEPEGPCRFSVPRCRGFRQDQTYPRFLGESGRPT